LPVATFHDVFIAFRATIVAIVVAASP